MGPSNGKVRASHGEARPTAAVTRPTAAVTRPTGAVSVNLAGRDLSKLPDWQRQILEKKYRAGAKRKREEQAHVDQISDSETDGDGFVVDDNASDWRKELKAITGYDPLKFAKEDLVDRSMEADWRAIQAEERRSARLGRGEDERAEQEELARQRAKAAAKKKARTQSSLVL